MSDREALRSMLIYAQREAETLNLSPLAHLLSLAIEKVDDTGMQADRIVLTDGNGDPNFYSHFAPRRLQ